MRCLVAVLLGFVLCTGGANAYASPLWGSDEIRVKRALAETDVLAFDLHRSSSGSARPVGETDSVVTLAQDFSLVAGGGHFDLEDHSLCRSLTWTSGATVLENNSCFAAVAFREMEVQNRAILAQVLSKTGTTGSGQLRYFAEAELGVSAPNAPPSALKEKAKGDTVEYRLGSTVVVRVSGSAGELNTEETRRFLRFLARYTPLHPQVRHDIAATRRLPARIEVELGQAKVGDGRHVMTFSNVRRTRSAYPLPAGMGSALARQASSGSNPRDLAVRRIAAVLAGVDPKPTLQSAFALARESTSTSGSFSTSLKY